MQCDLCGTKREEVFRAVIEGTELNVCSECARYGRVVGKRAIAAEPGKPLGLNERGRPLVPASAPKKEALMVIVPDFADRVKNKRESLGLKQKEFAKLISEKESLVHNVETGSFEPSIELARKLERFLRIKLVEEYEEEHTVGMPRTKDGELTIGDLLNTKE